MEHQELDDFRLHPVSGDSVLAPSCRSLNFSLGAGTFDLV